MTTLWRTVAMLLMGFALLASAAPGQVSIEQAALLYAKAYSAYTSQHPGFRLPDRAPTIHVTNMVKSYGENAYGLTCIVKINAVTLRCEAGEVLLSPELDIEGSALHASILFHEYIHYFQWIQHGPVFTEGELLDCERSVAWEREAYTLQMKMLERAQEWEGARLVRLAMAHLACPR